MSKKKLPQELQDAKDLLEQMGFVVLTRRSYEAAQRRQEIARWREQDAIEDKKRQREWMEKEIFPWKRHLQNRVNHLGYLALELGATTAQMLGGVPCDCGREQCKLPT